MTRTIILGLLLVIVDAASCLREGNLIANSSFEPFSASNGMYVVQPNGKYPDSWSIGGTIADIRDSRFVIGYPANSKAAAVASSAGRIARADGVRRCPHASREQAIGLKRIF